MITPGQQSENDRREFANTLRLQKAHNGYIVKTQAGPMVFVDLRGAFDFIEKHFEQK